MSKDAYIDLKCDQAVIKISNTYFYPHFFHSPVCKPKSSVCQKE